MSKDNHLIILKSLTHKRNVESREPLAKKIKKSAIIKKKYDDKKIQTFIQSVSFREENSISNKCLAMKKNKKKEIVKETKKVSDKLKEVQHPEAYISQEVLSDEIILRNLWGIIAFLRRNFRV